MHGPRSSSTFLLIFVVLVAPVGAAVVIAVLLLFGASPPLVFATGHAVKAAFQWIGVRAPNAVGVLSTVFVWWLAIVLVGLAWSRHRGRRAVTRGAPE